MIQVVGLSKAYGEQTLLENVSFNVNAGERIGLIGKNGHGKSTIFRIILGEESQDSGQVIIPQDYSIGCLAQHLHFQKDTVLEEGCLGLVTPDDGRDQSYRVKTILQGLGFSEEDFSKSPTQLSGGYQIRLNLAKLLVSEPHMLLLDEPTNYLDIVSMRWLSRFLQSWKRELILITHHSDFMDSVTTHTLGIHRKKIKKISGPTKKYYSQIALEEEVHEQSRVNQEKKRRDNEQFIERFRAKASKARAVQSRVKLLDKTEKLEKLEEIKSLDFQFRTLPFPGKYLLEVRNLSFSFDIDAPLITDLTFSVGKNDRIALIGKNGRGKTTLLNLLAGEIKSEKNAIVYSTNLKFSYFGQTNVERLNGECTVEEEILNVQPENNRTIARGICGLMMFEGDLALKKVKVLSGGEKSRTLLGKVLATPSNLLLLDEPTNHLDMDSTNAFQDAIKQYQGAVILVTHSEALLQEVANRLIIFDAGKVLLFEGTYRDFLNRIGWQDEQQETTREVQSSPTMNKRDLRRLRADIINRRSKTITPLKKQISEVEALIMETETAIEQETQLLIEVSMNGFGDDASKLSRSIHSRKAKVNELFDQLEQLTKEHDQYVQKFEQELAEITA